MSPRTPNSDQGFLSPSAAKTEQGRPVSPAELRYHPSSQFSDTDSDDTMPEARDMGRGNDVDAPPLLPVRPANLSTGDNASSAHIMGQQSHADAESARPSAAKQHLFKKRAMHHATDTIPETLYSLWATLQEEQAATMATKEDEVAMAEQLPWTPRKDSSPSPMSPRRKSDAPTNTRPSVVSLAQMRKSYLINCSSPAHPSLEFDLSKLTVSSVYPLGGSPASPVASPTEPELEWIDNDELEQQEMGRLAAVISLIRREQKHLRALVLLKGAFAEPLYKAHEQARRHPFSNFDRAKLERVFSIPIKMIPFHKLFLRDLETSVEKHAVTGTLSDVITTFNKHMPGFRYYLHYMDKYPEMITLLDELVHSSDYFRQTLEECTEQVEHINIRALLGNSREHISYYYGFLQKIMDLYSPEEPEYNGFAQCVAQFQAINAEAEKLSRIALQREEAKRIQHSMKGYSETLVRPTRRLIHQGNLAVVSLLSGKSALRTCLLFNDTLVFAKEKSDGRLHYKGHIDLESAYATELPPDQFVNLFAIMDSGNKKYYFQAEDECSSREWVQYINDVIHAI
ncbi:Dbl homology domain-containing protein [Syncephalis pseudoplumigaleata]|uniref:Dbl homology domain-containing protein n=1 Tax=Syncephalis pseudoplumigaleata TaxID=1712513 RepID=A0A4P9YZG2_9FUNG|nr:Dbl homology domain-containing protein [Syncephalis pseudoplumigaleata]|eukprot:RKP24801.1 Dbl homology domain-containing protein [Syncephalis pseudoplumigaleata]